MTAVGPLMVVGAILVQTGRAMLGVVLLSLAMGLLVAANLWSKEFPDVSADVSVGKKTLMARSSVPMGLEEGLKDGRGLEAPAPQGVASGRSGGTLMDTPYAPEGGGGGYSRRRGQVQTVSPPQPSTHGSSTASASRGLEEALNPII